MAKLNFKEISKMSQDERNKRLQDLKLEMIKAKGNAAKKGSANPKQVRKVIAKIHTANNQNKSTGTEAHKKKK